MDYMDKSARIYVAGHRGLVGSAICRQLNKLGYTNLVCKTRADLDLTKVQEVSSFFEVERPEYVFLAAAKVGGIQANNTYPADFIRDNLAIQQNVIDQAYQHNVKRLLFLGSSCIYPREAPQPISEESLLTGPLEPTNRPYAIAKIAGIEQCWAYNRQYGTQFIAAMPTNLYGPNDNYDLHNSHVLPALIRKFHEAKIEGRPLVNLWGTGRPCREFLYSGDMAAACIALLNLSRERFSALLSEVKPPLVNVGYGQDISILELAELVKSIIGYEGGIQWDATKPDGTLKKLIDSSLINNLGWRATVDLKQGICLAYDAFLKSQRGVYAE